MSKNKLVKILIIVVVFLVILIYPSAMNLYNANQLDSVLASLSSTEIYPGENVAFNIGRTSCSHTGSAKNPGPKAKTCFTGFDVVSRAPQDRESSVVEIRKMYDRLAEDGWYPRANDTSNFNDEFEHKLVPKQYYSELNKGYGAVSCDIEGLYSEQDSEFVFDGRCFYEEKLFGLSFR